jgi:hypothetical protein
MVRLLKNINRAEQFRAARVEKRVMPNLRPINMKRTFVEFL